MKQKPITKRERALMKVAYEQGLFDEYIGEGSFNLFLEKNNYVRGKIVIDFYSVRFLKR